MHSLRTKFLLAFITIAVIGMGTVALVANRVTTREFTLYVGQGGKMRAQKLAVDIADYYQQTGSWQGIETLLASQTEHTGQGRGRGQGVGGTTSIENQRTLLVDADRHVIADTENLLVGKKLAADDIDSGAPIVVDEQTIGTLLITTTDLSGHTELEQQFLSTVNRAIFLAGLFTAIAALIAAIMLSRQLVAPLHQLTTASEAMAGGDLSQRVDVRTRDEIGELGQAFNKMAGDLQAAEIQRQHMTADIAHELRNPLSVIRGNLEAMLDGIYPVDSEHLGPIYEETLLLQRLVQDLRLLSLADAGQLRLIKTKADLGQLLTGIVESARAIADDKQITLNVSVPQTPLIIDGDTDRLRQVIGNLLGNALRYTPQNGTITLGVKPQKEHTVMTVSDNGPGIASQDIPHIFDRFYRADEARDRASGGSGLGLAIVRALVQAHHGIIHVQSNLGQGTTFTITLPRYQA